MINEERVFFESGGLTIEGLYAPGEGSKGVVVTHPHSQMGGSMANNVVDALVAAFHDHGYATLRFNFRGVGRSEGRFDDGVGEQDDVTGAIAFLKEKGLSDITLAGYSFGHGSCRGPLPGMTASPTSSWFRPPSTSCNSTFLTSRGDADSSSAATGISSAPCVPWRK